MAARCRRRPPLASCMDEMSSYLRKTSRIHYPLALAHAAVLPSALLNYSVFLERVVVSGYCNDFLIICLSVMNEMEMYLCGQTGLWILAKRAAPSLENRLDKSNRERRADPVTSTHYVSQNPSWLTPAHKPQTPHLSAITLISTSRSGGHVEVSERHENAAEPATHSSLKTRLDMHCKTTPVNCTSFP
ncbi:hypothetical protein F2P79_004838 [Pimephales promelas]|nr:hypothetical protein F2P79_004838 [Pimephales promelas]